MYVHMRMCVHVCVSDGHRNRNGERGQSEDEDGLEDALDVHDVPYGLTLVV
jgi:hypothetical protein